MQKRILALGHDAYRAGSQIEFLHILQWLRVNHDSQISLVLRSGGELLDDYVNVLPTGTLEPTMAPGGPSILGSLRRRATQRFRARRHLPRRGSVDLIYANSSATASLAAELAAEAGCPVICHVHELEMSMHRFATRFREASQQIDGFIAVSGAVKRNLIVNHGIDPAKIDLVNGAIPLPHRSGTAESRSKLRTELGIPHDSFVVGGCGTVDWRKAPDIYLLIAKALAQRSPGRPTNFLWVGGEPEELEMVLHDIERLGLGDTVSFIGQRADPMTYFELFDAFLLTSREDPFPLVCLEAAALGVPIVCFAEGGGMPEFVEEDAGSVIPYLDIEAAVDRLLSMASSEDMRATLGRRGAAKVAERCSIDVIGPQIAAVLDRHLHRTTAESARIADTKERAGI